MYRIYRCDEVDIIAPRNSATRSTNVVFREADHKSDLKKIARIVVEDAKGLLDASDKI